MDVESDEEENLAGEGSSGYGRKRLRRTNRPPLSNAGAALTAPCQPAGNQTAYAGNPWQWMPQKWSQPLQAPPPWMLYQQPHMMGQQPRMMGLQASALQYPGAWMQVPTPLDDHVTPESAARSAKRHRRREYNNVAASRSNVGHMPNQLHIKLGGYVDQSSAAKNAWDDAIRSLVPELLDMNVIEWEGTEARVPTEVEGSLGSRIRVLGLPLEYAGIQRCREALHKDREKSPEGKVLGRRYAMPIAHPTRLVDQLANILGEQYTGGESRKNGQRPETSTKYIPYQKEGQRRARR
jgi:hypothetical protein